MKYWLAIASAAHVRVGRADGFMQVNHGKAAPLRRIRPGDGVVYYSPTTNCGQSDGLRRLTAIGIVREGEPYQGFMSEGFQPFRRDVDWLISYESPIGPLLGALELTAGKPNWGYQLRFGLVALGCQDFELIATAMGANWMKSCEAR
jgi:hypothetical protein